MEINRTSKVVLGGITVALIMLSLYGGTIIRSNRIFFLALATYIQAIPFAKTGMSGGITSYIAASVLGFILIPNKLYAGIYILFGVYPLIKLLAEKCNIVVEFVLKYFWLNATLALGYSLYSKVIVLNGIFAGSKGIIILVAAAQIVFFGYDYIFTKFIMFVQDRIFK
jgi:hypothetical protein